jgi:hypothetical protein
MFPAAALRLPPATFSARLQRAKPRNVTGIRIPVHHLFTGARAVPQLGMTLAADARFLEGHGFFVR